MSTPINKSSINWDNVLINASISALQGIQESGKLGMIAELTPELMASRAIAVGKELVRQLKDEIENESR